VRSRAQRNLPSCPTRRSSDLMHELRGERTGIRYRLTDAVQVQVSRVDLEARRIEFRLVKGTGFKALKASIEPETTGTRRIKRAASAKPPELKGTTSQQRRAAAKRSAKAAATAKTSRSGKAGKSGRSR